jgi:hypothetical protein
MAMNIPIPSLSELVSALSQRKTVADAANEAFAGYNQGKKIASEEALNEATIIEKLSDAQKKAHDAQKSPVQGQILLRSLKGQLPDAIYKALETASSVGPNQEKYVAPTTLSAFGTPFASSKEGRQGEKDALSRADRYVETFMKNIEEGPGKIEYGILGNPARSKASELRKLRAEYELGGMSEDEYQRKEDALMLGTSGDKVLNAPALPLKDSMGTTTQGAPTKTSKGTSFRIVQ